MEYDEFDGPDGVLIRVPTSDDYTGRAPSVAGTANLTRQPSTAWGCASRSSAPSTACRAWSTHSKTCDDHQPVQHERIHLRPCCNPASQQASKSIPMDAPVQIRLAARGPGEDGAYIEVSGRQGVLRELPINPERLHECRQVNDGPRSIALCQQLVDDLGGEVRNAVDEVLAQ